MLLPLLFILAPAPAAAAVLRVDTAVNVSENTMARSICVTVISADPGQVTEITLSLSLNGSSSGFATMGNSQTQINYKCPF